MHITSLIIDLNQSEARVRYYIQETGDRYFPPPPTKSRPCLIFTIWQTTVELRFLITDRFGLEDG